MIRSLANIALGLLFLGLVGVCTGAPSAIPGGLPVGTVVLRVQVIETTFTDIGPVSDCPADMQCIQMSGWFKYRARVTEVISGEWNQPEVMFGRIQHASFIDKVTRDCYVVLHFASPDTQSNIGVPFVAAKLLSNTIKSHRAEIKELRALDR